MNKLSTTERAQILTSLVEGNSIAPTCRMFGVNKITVLRLLADAGTLAAQYHDRTVYDLATTRVQVDEIWSFCFAKNDNVNPKNYRKGHRDCWTWVAIDADSKLVINWIVGNRNSGDPNLFVADLADHLSDRVQLTSDGLNMYRQAVNKAFGTEVDYAMLVKQYGAPRVEARYSPAEVVSVEREEVCGAPEPRHISTSHIERQNLTMRMSMRRFIRLTNGFSKKIENHKHAVALHYFHCNFLRVHHTTKTTPAMAAGIADKEWTMVDFVKMREKEELISGGRLTNYKPNPKKRYV
ncbi:MAG TPA: IS1 family transposase [Tepidisphaeraceae bacterium]|jgi:IS1 family transposase|nr:IS1 family transposase [Tepidisphaeraceae bacterium]